MGHRAGNAVTVGVLAMFLAGCGASSSSSTTTTSGAATTGDTDAKAATGWIHKSAHYTNEVQVAVQSVQAGVKMIDGNSSAADLAALSSLVKQSQDYCDDATMFLVGEEDGHMKAQREEAFTGAYDLKEALGKLRKYLDSQKPSDLGDFQTGWAQGRQEWNDAITTLYATAAIPKPPLV